MKLEDFPNVVAAFNEIEHDSNGVFAAPLKLEAAIPKKWTAHFEICERLLAKAATLKPTKAMLKKAGCDDDDYGFETVRDMVVASVNDSAEVGLAVVAKSAKEHTMAGDLLYHFFDGDLNSVFTGPRPTLAEVKRRGRH